MAAELNATVTRRSDLHHGLLIIRVKPDFTLPPFKAGQYAVLGLPGSAPRIDYADPEPPESRPDPDKLVRRAYSIASSSLQGEYLEFYVALVRSGALTPRLFALEEGDRLFLGEKVVGMFTLDDVPEGHDVLFVATGTGLAPYISMLRSAFRFEHNRTIVLHGARNSWDLGYRNELEALAAHWPRFHYLPVVDDGNGGRAWSGRIGRVQDFLDDGTVESLLGRKLAPERLAVFLCGNPAMIREVQERLAREGFTVHSRKQPGSIFVEKFW